MSRVDFLRTKWTVRLRAGNGPIDYLREGLSPDELFDALLEIDPTPRKVYGDFVLRCYAAGTFLLEDAARIKSTLSRFHAVKRRLPADLRDIGVYRDERDLHAAIVEAGFDPGTGDAADESPVGKAARRADRDRAYLDSEVIVAEGWTTAKLLSHDAAKWWGLGTRWCTTEASGSTYAHYAKDGPLRVFVSPSGDKYQFHSGSAQLCDASDRSIGLRAFFEDGPLPAQLIAAARDDVAGVFAAAGSEMHALSRFPETLLAGAAVEARARLVAEGLEATSVVAEQDGWRLTATNDRHGLWAVYAVLGHPDADRGIRGTRWGEVPEGLLETAKGDRMLARCDLHSLPQLLDLLPAMPSSIRERLLAAALQVCTPRAAVYARLMDRAFRECGDALPAELWHQWASRIADLDRTLAPPGTIRIPDAAMDVRIAKIFADAGLSDLVPGPYRSDDVLCRMVNADPSLLAEQGFADGFSEEGLAAACASSRGESYRLLPARLRTLALARRMVAIDGSCLSAVRDGCGNVDCDGRDCGFHGFADDGTKEELALSALDTDPWALLSIRSPLPRDVYLRVVRAEPFFLRDVPVEFRDVEMCLAAGSELSRGDLAAFPGWVAKRLFDDPSLPDDDGPFYACDGGTPEWLALPEPDAGTAPDRLPALKDGFHCFPPPDFRKTPAVSRKKSPEGLFRLFKNALTRWPSPPIKPT